MPLLLSPTSSSSLPLTIPSPLSFHYLGSRSRVSAPHSARPPWEPRVAPTSASRPPPPPPRNSTGPTSTQELLQAIVGSDGVGGEPRNHLPAVRSYENDLARLTLVGAVGFEKALTAAAADGGDAAEEHLASGLRTMVIETVYPGGSSERSTVSTRLFLPSREVKEKARKIRSSLADDLLSGTTSRNILAMTFRQVLLQRLWSLELALFPPGTERDMGDLASSREVSTYFTVSSSNEMVITALAEAICSCALASTNRGYLHIEDRKAPNVISGWFQKPLKTATSDSSVCIYSIPPNQIFENARERLDSFISMEGRSPKQKRKAKHPWWPPPVYLNLDKIGGLGCSDWANEYIPAYRLQIDCKKLKDAKLEGWQRLADDRWEVLLTHFQMVELADILDMYYEDQYTLPDKHFSCGSVAQVSNSTRNERKNSWKKVSTIVLAGCVLVVLRIMAQIHWHQLPKPSNSSVIQTSTSVSETDYIQPQTLEAAKLEELCFSVVKRIQDALDGHGDITIDKDVGAWVGELPSCLRKLHISEFIQDISGSEVALIHSNGDLSIRTQSYNSEISPGTNGRDIPSRQDIAGYQVVLSQDGNVLGFQPTTRAAVNHWAANPLAQALYERKKLSPGFLEPSLKIPQPQEVAVIELLMSVNPDSWFVLARPFQ